MANIILSSTDNVVNVSGTTNTISVTDDSGQSVANIVTTDHVIAVESNPLVVEVSETAFVSTTQIREAISNTAPITYDIANGVIGIDENAIFTGKTTDDLAEGSTNLYLNGAGTTDDLVEGSTNVYYQAFRARGAIGATAPILYNPTTGIISLDTEEVFSNALANAWFTTQTTDDLTQGSTNLYLNGGTTDDLTEGSTNEYYTNAKVQVFATNGFGGLLVNGNSDVNGNLTVTGNAYLDHLEISGNLTVDDITANGNITFDAGYNIIGPHGKIDFNKEGTHNTPTVAISADENIELYFANSTIFPGYQGNIDFIRGDTSQFSVITTHSFGHLGGYTFKDKEGTDLVELFHKNPGIPGETTYALNHDANVHTSFKGCVSVGKLDAVTPGGGDLNLNGSNNTIRGNNFGGESDLFIGSDKSLELQINASVKSSRERYFRVTSSGFGPGLNQYYMPLEIENTGNVTFDINPSDNFSNQSFKIVNNRTSGTDKILDIRAEGGSTNIPGNIDLLNGEINIRHYVNKDSIGTYGNVVVMKGNTWITDSEEKHNLRMTGAYGPEFSSTNTVQLHGDTNGDGNGGVRILAANNTIAYFANADITMRRDTSFSDNNISNVTDMTAVKVTTNTLEPKTDGNIEVTGNLNVQGNLNYVNVEDLLVNDQSITLNYGNVAQDAQIIIDRTGSTGSNVELKWNETTDRWQFTNDGTTYYNLPESTTDVAEGTNLYYANALVADYMQDYVTNNFAVTPTEFDLSNALSNINSITHENGNDITLNSESKLVLTQQMNTSETVTETGNIKGDGYAVILDGGHSYASGNISQQGTNNLNAYAVSGTATAGSSVFTITGVTELKNVFNGTGVIDGTNNDLSLTGDMVADMIFDNWSGVDGSQFPYPPGTRLVSASTSQLVFTENAIDNLTFANAEPIAIVHGGYDSSTGQLISFVSQDDAVADGTQVVNIDSAGNFGMFPFVFTGETPIAGETNDSIVIGLPSTPVIPGGTPVAFANVTGTGASNINGQTLYINRDVFGDAFNYTLTTDAAGTTAATMTGFGLSAGASGGGDITYSVSQSDSVISKSRMYVQGAYGFGKNGPNQNDFAYTTGSASDYTIDLSSATTSFRQRTALDVERGVLKAPNGLVIGENTEMSNRGEKDSFNNFGLNMMWDGLTDIGSQYAGTSGVIPQILFKAYTDNTSGTGGGNGRTGPRLLFSSATGNSGDSEFEIYPLENQEIGRTTYWGTTQQIGSAMSTVNPAGFISATAAEDWTNNNNLNMAFAANGSGFNNPDVFIKYHNGKLVLASADLADAPGIHLAPAEVCNGDASQTYATLGHTWANVNYADTVNKTGSKFTITQGNADATTDGDIALVFDREYIAGVATDTMGTPTNGGFTTFDSSGLSGMETGNETGDTIILQFANFSNPGLAVGTEVTFADVEGPGNTNLNGQTFYVGRVLFGAIVTLWTSADGTTTPALGATVGLVDANAYSPSGTGNGTMQWTVTGTTAKQWSITLDQGTDNLKFKSNGTNVMHFTDERVHIDEVFRLVNLSTAEINALPNPESGDTVYNTTLNQICFYNGSAWQKITSATM